MPSSSLMSQTMKLNSLKIFQYYLIEQSVERQNNPHKNSQAVKNEAALESQGEKSCEIKGDGQEMAAMMLMLIHFNNAHSHY